MDTVKLRQASAVGLHQRDGSSPDMFSRHLLVSEILAGRYEIDPQLLLHHIWQMTNGHWFAAALLLGQ